MKKLVAFIVEEHSPTYLRALNDEELDLILRRNAERGLPGRIGSLDCSHWEWRNCPKGMAGIHQNRKAKRSIIMETVCDEDLWIWHLFVGCPGSMNDLNVMYQSPLYHDVTSGAWPPRDKPFTVNGRTRTLLCYLVDGIYPHYPCFICAYPNTDTPKKKVFNRLQEAIRKDAERLYGVLNSRFHVAPHRARYATITAVIEVAKAIAILHNMVTEIRRGGYVSRSRSRMYAEAAMGGTGSGACGAGTGAGVGQPGADNGGSGEGGAGPVAPVLATPVGPVAPVGPAAPDGAMAAAPAGPHFLPPVVQPLGQMAPNAYVRAMRAWRELRNESEHVALRNDLAEHVYQERAVYLEPYL